MQGKMRTLGYNLQSYKQGQLFKSNIALIIPNFSCFFLQNSLDYS